MTRETKIGLLVGLAFIIVIGILLSDHMTSTTQPQQALLSDAAPNVRESVVAPAAAQPPPPAAAAPPITPASTLPTHDELRAAAPPPPVNVVERVRIGGPAGDVPGVGPVVIRQSGRSPIVIERSQPAPQPPTDIVASDSVEGSAGDDPAGAAATELDGRAGGGGEQASIPVARATIDRSPAAPGRQPGAASASAVGREYVAQAGDNLSKLASRMLGVNSKANRNAIVRANASLQRNPDLILEGRKYKIPMTLDGPAAAAADGNADGTAAIPETVPLVRRTAPVPVAELVPGLAASAPAEDVAEWYVVKENDNLWRIAAEQLGSGNAWLQIKELNRDVLQGGERVLPDMRLRLPAGRVATAGD